MSEEWTRSQDMQMLWTGAIWVTKVMAPELTKDNMSTELGFADTGKCSYMGRHLLSIPRALALIPSTAGRSTDAIEQADRSERKSVAFLLKQCLSPASASARSSSETENLRLWLGFLDLASLQYNPPLVDRETPISRTRRRGAQKQPMSKRVLLIIVRR